jgi:hypothetical protein
MPMPFASPLRLTDDERQGLASLARAHSTPQALACRCRLILRVAAPEAPTNLCVAADMPCHRQTVSLWRPRYLEHRLAGVHDAPRPGRPRRFSPRGARRCPVARDEYPGRLPPASDALELGGYGRSPPRPCPSPGDEPLDPLAGA